MLGALPASLLMAGCSDDAVIAITGSGTLRAGVRADVVGFGYLNEGTGNYYGMEIDLVEELASRLGYGDIEFVTILPENRKEMLLDGQVDLIAACYSIAETRLENFDFSPAYYDDRVIAVVQNSSLIEGIDDMRGLTFGTMSGANAAPLLSTKLYEDGFTSGEVVTANEDNSDVSFDTWHLLQFPSYQELSDALEDGTVDAMVLDGAIAQTYMDDKRHVIDGFVVAEQSYGIATQKDSELSAPVAEAVQGMLDDGTIDALVDKWD
ncbi:transporter substrate-binding domain-containing protein [Olsenella sp. An270]|uniref:transporter substrate-binding domain-containing protein n=1 Tax=Olsenella sp. An270 TaxID=1965615 RepID=UPI001EF5F9CE|nr:transporter substrate-binding domain-containing protein [Olsenella sp. An270]